MFEISGTRITITRGDTALLSITAEGVALTKNDRAVFTVSRGNGGILMEKVAVPDRENRVLIPFLNSETQGWREGSYSWDVRYVLGALTDERGRVIDGDEVLTPIRPGELTVIKAVGSI